MHYLIILITLLSISIPNPNQLELSIVEDIEETGTKQFVKIEEIKAGTLIRRISGTNDYELIPQLETDISIDIQGMVSSTIMEQKFINNSDKMNVF